MASAASATHALKTMQTSPELKFLVSGLAPVSVHEARASSRVREARTLPHQCLCFALLSGEIGWSRGSIGCATAGNVEHGAGREGVFLRGDPSHQRCQLLDQDEAVARDLRQHEVDMLLRD